MDQEEDSEFIDSIDEFDYQDINEQEYEIVYEETMPTDNDELLEKPKNPEILTKSKRKSKTLTFREKYEVIFHVEKGVSVQSICDAYGIGRTTVYDYMRRKQEILNFISKSDDADRKTFKRSKYPDVEDRVLKWCESNETFTKQQLHECAKSAFAEARESKADFSPSGFCGSWSWTKRFFHRHPDLKKKFVTATGEPVDPSELYVGHVEAMDEINDENVIPQVKLEAARSLRKIKFLNLSEKLQVLDDIDASQQVPAIAEKFDVSRATIYDIFKRRKELRETKLTKSNCLRKVVRLPRYPQLELELLQWCLKQKSFPLSNTLIADMALCVFETLGLTGKFNPSSVWAKKFVLRHPELCKLQGIQSEDEVPGLQEELYEDDQVPDEFNEAAEFGEDESRTESLEFMEPESLPECHEEYIIEELDPQHDEELEIETVKVQTEPSSSEGPQKEAKKLISYDETLIPDKVALKSLKILLKYSRQRGYTSMLPHLADFHRELNAVIQ